MRKKILVFYFFVAIFSFILAIINKESMQLIWSSILLAIVSIFLLIVIHRTGGSK
jgi:hypothetical protein